VAQSLHPAAETAKGLVYATSIITLIYGIIMIAMGALFLIVIVGVIPLIFGIIDITIYSECKNIMRLIDERKYGEAKSKTLTWMIVGFILGGLIPGILLLIAYIKLGEVPVTPATTPV